ncbi:hypothetical protein Tco_0908335 [Tanacetum coccineum]|uniref:Reverse transcriptase zinc-binding domain-containing protein n=1 Tax=Tanacetum coccineum TaxID=301880 RepID=A0ABQ5CMY2_9ASTR
MKNFLWDSSGNGNGRAKIAWKVVCRPKDQGGLGIKPLNEWNEVLLMKNIWKIVEQKQTLWVQWVNRVKLKGRSVWDIDIDVNDSWGWKKLIELRDRIKPHIFHNIGNGKSTSVWFKDNDCVFDMIENGRWRWPSEWWEKFPVLKSINVPCLSEKSDQKLISKVELAQDSLVSQCNKGNHLSYGLHAQKVLLTHVVLHKWDEWSILIVVHYVINQDMHYNNSIKSILTKIGLAACVYNIWRERNLRIFQNAKRKEEDIAKIIMEDIKWKLASLTVKKSKSAVKIYKKWDINPVYS